MPTCDKLDRCKHCGSEAEVRKTTTWDYFVKCTNKQCGIQTRKFHDNMNGAISCWNSRFTEEVE